MSMAPGQRGVRAREGDFEADSIVCNRQGQLSWFAANAVLATPSALGYADSRFYGYLARSRPKCKLGREIRSPVGPGYPFPISPR